MDVINAYREIGTYRGAGEMCGVRRKTVKRILDRGQGAAERVARRRKHESVRALVVSKVELTRGRISAKRLLPEAVAAGYGTTMEPPGRCSVLGFDTAAVTAQGLSSR